MKSRGLFVGIVLLGFIINAQAQTRLEVIEQNTQPIGQVTVAGAALAAANQVAVPASPESLYKKNCAFCHDTGAAGAPKYGDKPGWAVHLAKGPDVLKEHALKGFKAMPAKGLCPQCSDEDTISALDYLLKSVQ